MRKTEGEYDVIVIGTGMGGSTLGHRLTEHGLRVLFLEKGRAEIAVEASVDSCEDAAARLAVGRWPHRIDVTVDGVTDSMFLPLGCGAGGSTIFYSAALERFERSDVEPLPNLSHPTGGWPVPWTVWSRYYNEAERLFRVLGTVNPLDPSGGEALVDPPPASEADCDLVEAFRRCGLHPYRLHVALSYLRDCRECGGRYCSRNCKGSAKNICLEPSLRSGRARLLDQSEVIRIETDRHRVNGVLFLRAEELHTAKARFVVLAAGAYHSPALLLRSRSEAWPDGLANRSGLVGKNLMFHANEWFALWPPRRSSPTGPRKTIGFRDLYSQAGTRLGSVQSTGLEADFANIQMVVLERFERSRWRVFRFLRLLLKLAARLAAFSLGKATIFVLLIEDFAHAHNRVSLDPDDPARIRITYTIPEELKKRAVEARSLLRRSLSGLRMMPLQTGVQLNFGHPCGTCRFGTDESTSVLGPDCRAHGIDNLYVVDSSFMPSSGGANPALTIAANALRVADLLSERFAKERSMGLHDLAVPS